MHEVPSDKCWYCGREEKQTRFHPSVKCEDGARRQRRRGKPPAKHADGTPSGPKVRERGGHFNGPVIPVGNKVGHVLVALSALGAGRGVEGLVGVEREERGRAAPS